MQIKELPRVLYDNNPLIEVLAQVRFDRLLSLSGDAPKALQVALSKAGYTQLNIEQSASIQIAFGPGSTVSEGAAPMPGPGIPTIFHFSSQDGQRKFTVCADFVAFSTSTYTEWKDFKASFMQGFAAFAAIYGDQAAVRRVGLRYKDLIEREALNLAGVPWSELLAPIVSGVFSAHDLAEPGTFDEQAIEQQASQVLLRLDNCKVLLQSAILRSAQDSSRQAFLVDSDFFKDLSGLTAKNSGIAPLLDDLHRNANAVFRHCIKEKLHAALLPQLPRS